MSQSNPSNNENARVGAGVHHPPGLAVGVRPLKIHSTHRQTNTSNQFFRFDSPLPSQFYSCFHFQQLQSRQEQPNAKFAKSADEKTPHLCPGNLRRRANPARRVAPCPPATTPPRSRRRIHRRQKLRHRRRRQPLRSARTPRQNCPRLSTSQKSLR